MSTRTAKLFVHIPAISTANPNPTPDTSVSTEPPRQGTGAWSAQFGQLETRNIRPALFTALGTLDG
jgi:hypothetical protein